MIKIMNLVCTVSKTFSQGCLYYLHGASQVSSTDIGLSELRVPYVHGVYYSITVKLACFQGFTFVTAAKMICTRVFQGATQEHTTLTRCTVEFLENTLRIYFACLKTVLKFLTMSWDSVIKYQTVSSKFY